MTDSAETHLQIDVLATLGAAVGEGPVWLAKRSEVLWIDMPDGLIHFTKLSDKTTHTIGVGSFLGAVAPRRAGGWVAATYDGFAAINDEGVLAPEPDILARTHRMNDAKCDPSGRFWSGSTEIGFAAGEGALHALDTDWSSRQVLTGLTLPNGLAWSADGRTFYLADSVDRVIYAFDCDLGSATLSRRRDLYRFASRDGMPDGLCIDTDGCLWVALWGGNRVVRISPDGRRIGEVILPPTQTSSCTFVGPSLSDLAVTSAAAGLSAGPYDGALYLVRGLGVTGTPATPFAG